jgi:hypothetical protein
MASSTKSASTLKALPCTSSGRDGPPFAAGFHSTCTSSASRTCPSSPEKLRAVNDQSRSQPSLCELELRRIFGQ